MPHSSPRRTALFGSGFAAAALLTGAAQPPASPAAVAATPALTSPAPAPTAAPFEDKVPKGVHRNKVYGFEFKHPKTWNNIAMKTSENWLAAKYVSDKTYTFYDKDIGWTMEHTPEILVVAFPHKVMEKGGVKKDETEKDGEKVVTIEITNPYKDYDDFLTREFSGGGFYLSDQEEDEIDGVKVTKLTYTVDKGTRSGPQTIETWVYHGEDVDYAVQLVGLTKHWKKITKETKLTRQTFKLIERTGSLDHSGATSQRFIRSLVNLSDETPKERRSRAQASEKSIHEAAIAKLPSTGWTHAKKKRVMMISSAEKRFNKRIQSHVNNMFDWLDKEFGFLGEDAYMRVPVVRICASEAEAAAFTAGVQSGGYGGYWYLSEELLVWKDDEGWIGSAVDRLNSQIYRYWMAEKNFELSTAMPNWIDSGLDSMLTNSRMDSRKVDWRNDSWEIDRYRVAVAEGKSTPLRDIFLQTSEDAMKSFSFSSMAEHSMLVKYLASPDVRRHPLAKGLLKSYMQNMIVAMEEIEKDAEEALEAARKKALDDEEDEGKGYADARKKIFAQREKDLLQRTFDLTFADWDDKDWEKFTKAFHDSY